MIAQDYHFELQSDGAITGSWNFGGVSFCTTWKNVDGKWCWFTRHGNHWAKENEVFAKKLDAFLETQTKIESLY